MFNQSGEVCTRVLEAEAWLRMGWSDGRRALCRSSALCVASGAV